MKNFKQLKEDLAGRVQVHYGSKDGFGKDVKIIATVPPMTEPAIENKYDLMRKIEKYIKDMKTKGLIKGNDYKIVYPHDPQWRGSK